MDNTSLFRIIYFILSKHSKFSRTIQEKEYERYTVLTSLKDTVAVREGKELKRRALIKVDSTPPYSDLPYSLCFEQDTW